MPQPKLRIHVASETAYIMKGQGVHTAFVDAVNLLKSQDDVEVIVNQEGLGDVLHCHTYGPYFFWKGRKYKGRRIFTVHVIPDSIKGSLPAWHLFMPFVRWYFKRVYSYADVCIAISPMVEEAIRALKANTRIVRIYNPIPMEKYRPSPEKRAAGRSLLGLKDDEFVVLGVGQLQARKGVEDFIDIAEAVPKAKFVWAGGRPFGLMTEGIHKLNNRIAKTGGRIQFPGLFELDQMPLIYNAADILLFPSYQENCPLVPVEAAAGGLPVVYRDIREYRELYEHPYLKAGDTAAFVAMTKKLMNDHAFYLEAQRISQQLIEQFDQQQVRRKLIALYRELAGGNTSSNLGTPRL